MKILNLYFKNINSLEGESRIDFQQNPLANSGVFAIVGPNGSGKSSILDAISLAFYGETFRFDRPAEHVMTAHTTESFAQVEFALGEQKFRTRWQVQRKDNQVNGELLPPQMQLVALTENGEEVLEQTSHGVSDKITEIIGMDFRNFSRSIMLAQGDFAAFLNALDSERMDILEKMSSSDIYEVSRQELRDSAVTAKTAVEQIKQELATLPVMDAVAIEAGEHDLADFREQVTEFKLQQNQIREQLAWTQNIAALENQVQTLEKNQRQTTQQLEQKHLALDKVNAVQSVLVFKDDIASINDLQAQVKQSNNNCKVYKEEITQLKGQLSSLGLSATTSVPTKNITEQKQAIDELKHQVSQLKLELGSQTGLQTALNKQIAEKQALQTATLRWLESHSAEKSLIDHFPDTVRLRELRAEIVELDAQHQIFVKKFKNSDQSLKKNEAALTQAKNKCLDYEQQLLAAEDEVSKILENSTLAELESLLIFQQQRVEDFNELYALARVNQKVSSGGFFSFFSKKTELEDVDLVALKKQADDLADQVAQAKNIKNTLEQALFNEVLIQRLRHERPHLVDGLPCPLCGALQHPYSKLPPKEVDSRQALTNQKIRLQELTSKADVVTRQIARVEKAAEDATVKDKNIEKIRFEFNVLSNKLNVGSSEFGINNLSNLKGLLQREQAELTNIQNLLKRHAQQQDKITKLNLHIEKEQTTIKQLNEERGQLSSDTGILPKEMQDLAAALDTCRAEEKILAEEVLGQLAALGETMPDSDKEEALTERLTTRRRDYYTHVLRDKALTEELEPLQQKAAVSQQKVEQHNERLQELSALLQIEESAGLQLALLEKQKLLLEQEQLHNTLQQQLRSLQQAFETKLTGTQFTSFKQVEEALALMATQGDLEQEIIVLEQQLERIAQDLQKVQAQLAAEQKQALTATSTAELEAQQRSISEKLAIATEEVKHLEEKLRKQASYQEKHTVLNAQLEQQQKQLAELEKNLRLSEANGMAFRRQVQLKMITQLLSQTNKMLEKISGRYYVRQVPTEQGLALEIEDTLQQNIRRQPKSLSGGETFLISLALALGLSELANNGKAVDSLFLDEGFGSLDPDALNTVVNTLQSLRMQGKTVGVISHVEAVRKRIKTRIEMVKKPNGLSQLKKVS
jgi:exonuclease SbcC